MYLKLTLQRMRREANKTAALELQSSLSSSSPSLSLALLPASNEAVGLSPLIRNAAPSLATSGPLDDDTTTTPITDSAVISSNSNYRVNENVGNGAKLDSSHQN
jgi:hypothetical protein